MGTKLRLSSKSVVQGVTALKAVGSAGVGSKGVGSLRSVGNAGLSKRRFSKRSFAGPGKTRKGVQRTVRGISAAGVDPGQGGF